MGTEEREGERIYSEGKVEVRTFPRDGDSHSVYIGDNCFLLQRGCLEQFAMRTSPEDLEFALARYNPSFPHVLSKESIDPRAFALVLARARVKELDAQLSDAYGTIRTLRNPI